MAAGAGQGHVERGGVEVAHVVGGEDCAAVAEFAQKLDAVDADGPQQPAGQRQDGQIEGASESFHDFQARVDDVLHEIAAGKGRALVVTSGGLIAMAIRVAMGLELGAFARLALTIMNTSVHQLHPVGAGLTLTQFNGVPHLARRDRQHAQTFI